MWATFMYLCRHVNVIRRPVNVCHGFVPSCFRYFCHSNVFHAHACHAIMCHAIVTSCKCLSCKRGHVNERPTSASSCVPSWLPKRFRVQGMFFLTIVLRKIKTKTHFEEGFSSYTIRRDEWRYKNWWIFGKGPNGLWPPLHFRKVILRISRQKCVCSYGGTFVYFMILFPMRCM